MTRITLFTACLSMTLAACSGHSVRTAGEAPSIETSQLNFKLASGTYRCEAGMRVDVARHPATPERMQLNWQGKTYALVRDNSASGLPRFEESKSGLVWIDLPWKGILLDGQTHKPLASECSPVAV